MQEPPLQQEIQPRVVIKPQAPAEILPVDITYKTLTTETVEDLLSINDVYMCVSWQDYLTLAQWEQEKLRYIKQLNENIKFLEEQIKELE